MLNSYYATGKMLSVYSWEKFFNFSDLLIVIYFAFKGSVMAVIKENDHRQHSNTAVVISS